jgi:formylglycine-generating enzyme required for sulfatase activity
MFNVRMLKIVSVLTVFFFTWGVVTADFTFADVRTEEMQEKDKSGKDESGNSTNIIVKKGKKKKWPWWYFAAGAVVLGVAVYIIFKPKPPEPDIETLLGFEWRSIPEGDFLMGDNFGDGDTDETPVHKVYLDRYEISKYEVTFEQYDRFCDDTGRSKPDDNNWSRDNRPVINVSWDDATAFCQWLSSKTGKNFDLPTEAQWEKAARGAGQYKYPWGDALPGCNRANYGDCPPSTTVEVGLFPDGQSPFGVYDMAGNVWEWCKDWHNSSYYENSPDSNPQGPDNGTSRIVRGGCYSSPAKNIRTTDRHRRDPTETHENYIGFRICRNY